MLLLTTKYAPIVQFVIYEVCNEPVRQVEESHAKKIKKDSLSESISLMTTYTKCLCRLYIYMVTEY